MKAEDLRAKSADELTKFILDSRKEQFNLRFQKANGQLDNTAQLRGLRRGIARAKTLLKESDLGITREETKKKAPAKTAAPKKTAAKKAPAKKTTKKDDK